MYYFQMLDYVSKLTPAQIKLQQSIVEEHVQKEAAEKNLNEAQTALLLAQTLEHNGLPQINAAPSKIGFVNSVEDTNSAGENNGIFANIASGISGIYNSFTGNGKEESESEENNSSGLPTPGTLTHTVTLGLFKMQQAINQAVNGDGNILTNFGEVASNLITGQPSAQDKIGEAAVASHQTFSQVPTGIDPKLAALGLLTTGALGSVLYSSVANANVATSATRLAKDAFDTVSRNRIVSSANSVISYIIGEDSKKRIDNDYNTNYGHFDYDTGFNYYDYGNPYYQEIDYRHLPYEEEFYQTNFAWSKPKIIPVNELDPDSKDYENAEYVKTEQILKNIKPVYVAESITEEDSEHDLNMLHSDPQPVAVKFFSPVKNPPETPFISYTDDHNPWSILESGLSTEHLYH